jgi:hypothetical protein
MTAQFLIDPDVTPLTRPDEVSASDTYEQVWFEYIIKNVGDEAGTPINFYVTVDDVQSGEIFHSEFVTLEDSVDPGHWKVMGSMVDHNTFGSLAAGDYWFSLRNESGYTLGAARFTVTP